MTGPEKLNELLDWLNENSDSWRAEHQKDPMDRYLLTVYPSNTTEFLTVYSMSLLDALEDMRQQLEAHQRWQSSQKQGCIDPPPF